MTTATFTRVAPSSPAQRIGRVLRLQFANPWTTITLPWIVLGAILLLNLAIWFIIFSATGPGDRADVAKGLQYSGSSSWIFCYMAVVAVQAINITFPFALGYGVTRRDYYLGTVLSFGMLAAMYAIGMTILSVVEQLTNGWGFGGRMFTAIYFGDDWVQRLWIFFVALLFFFFVGAAFAAVFVRWKATGLVFTFVGLGAVGVGIVALLAFSAGWARFGSFFAAAGLVGSYSWSLVVTALAGIAGYLMLRRATPRS